MLISNHHVVEAALERYVPAGSHVLPGIVKGDNHPYRCRR